MYQVMSILKFRYATYDPNDIANVTNSLKRKLIALFLFIKFAYFLIPKDTQQFTTKLLKKWQTYLADSWVKSQLLIVLLNN